MSGGEATVSMPRTSFGLKTDGKRVARTPFAADACQLCDGSQRGFSIGEVYDNELLRVTVSKPWWIQYGFSGVDAPSPSTFCTSARPNCVIVPDARLLTPTDGARLGLRAGLGATVGAFLTLADARNAAVAAQVAVGLGRLAACIAGLHAGVGGGAEQDQAGGEEHAKRAHVFKNGRGSRNFSSFSPAGPSLGSGGSGGSAGGTALAELHVAVGL